MEHFTSYRSSLPIEKRKEIPQLLIDHFKLWQNRLNTKIRFLAMDNGTEFVNCSLQTFATQYGIGFELSKPNYPQ